MVDRPHNSAGKWVELGGLSDVQLGAAILLKTGEVLLAGHPFHCYSSNTTNMSMKSKLSDDHESLYARLFAFLAF